MIDFDYMEFICWVDDTLYPLELADDLRELGLEAATALYYKLDWQNSNRRSNDRFSIVRLYQNYCISDEDLADDTVGYYLQIWLDNRYKAWQGKPEKEECKN